MGKRKWWKKKQQKASQQGNKPVIATSSNDRRINAATTVFSKPCHDGIIPVFEHKNVTFWGGKAKLAMTYNDWDLMVLFSDRDTGWETNEPQPFINANHSAREILDPSLFLQTRHAPWIGLDWPDFWQPTMDADWWWTLLDNIYGWGTPDTPKNVVFGCTGGHGRTGTALAVVRGLLQPADDMSDPVAWVRKAYCDRAVEARCQAEYVEEITGKAVYAQPSWSPVNTYSTTGSGYERTYGADTKAQGSAHVDLSQYEIGDRKDEAEADKYAREVEEIERLDERKDLQRIVDAQIREELGLAPNDPLQATADGRTYRAITNAAGDIIRWEERKDVAI